MTDRSTGKKKLRPREHVIADLGVNYLQRRVLLRGHAFDTIQPDYGIDSLMYIYNDNREAENGAVNFQVKATDHLNILQDGKTISNRLETSHLRYWHGELMPVIFVLYDASRDRAFWLYMQNYIDEHDNQLHWSQKENTIRIPVRNRLTLRAIDNFHTLRDECYERFTRSFL